MLSDDTDTTGMADEFAAGWRSPARRVVTANLADEAGVRAAFADTGADAERPPVGSSSSSDPGRPRTPIWAIPSRARGTSVWSIASTVRAVVGGWHGRSPRLWLVTRRGLVVSRGRSGRPHGGALKGLIRVLAYEHPDLHATLVDLDDGADSPADFAAVAAELGVTGRRRRHRLRSGQRYVERLSAGAAERAVRPRSGGPPRRRVHRHRRSRRTGPGRRPMARRQWCRSRRPQWSRASRPTSSAHVLAELEQKADIAVVTGDIATPGWPSDWWPLPRRRVASCAASCTAPQ